jgi:transposase
MLSLNSLQQQVLLWELTGTPIKEIARRLGRSRWTIYNWRKQLAYRNAFKKHASNLEKSFADLHQQVIRKLEELLEAQKMVSGENVPDYSVQLATVKEILARSLDAANAQAAQEESEQLILCLPPSPFVKEETK